MNKEQLDELVNGIVNIEKDTMRKRFDIQSGKGVQYARAKADVDAVNGILNYIDNVQEEGEEFDDIPEGAEE